MIKLTYTPRKRDGSPARPKGHLALVGKGIMYDAGGISLKPSDAMHFAMKQDMSGAAAVLGSMLTLQALGCPTRGDRLPHVHGQHAVGQGDAPRRRADDPRRDDRRGLQHRRRGPARHGRRARARHRARSAARRHRDDRDADGRGAADVRDGARRHPRQPPGPRRPDRGGRITRPTSRSGSCRWSSATGASSIRPSPTSRTSAARTPAPSRPGSSSRSSPPTSRSATSTSAVR